MQKMPEHLTREQMAEKYPDQCIGINNIQYQDNDGVTIESADVIYTDKTEEELLTMQVTGSEDIMCWYTSGNQINIGVVEIC